MIRFVLPGQYRFGACACTPLLPLGTRGAPARQPPGYSGTVRGSGIIFGRVYYNVYLILHLHVFYDVQIMTTLCINSCIYIRRRICGAIQYFIISSFSIAKYKKQVPLEWLRLYFIFYLLHLSRFEVVFVG